MQKFISKSISLAIILATIFPLAPVSLAAGPNMIVDPLPGQILSHTVLIKTNVKSGAIQFYVDGKTFGNSVSLPPYQIVLDTTQFSDGPHVLGISQGLSQRPSSNVFVRFQNTQKPTRNLIYNSGLEYGSSSPQTWTSSSWGDNDATFTYPAAGHSGRGAEVSITNYSSGDAKWFFNDIQVTPGKQYNFSDFYKSDVATQIVARFSMNDGTFIYFPMGSATASQDWSQFNYSLITPDNTKSMTVFHLIQSPGTLFVDDYYLGLANSLAFGQGMVSINFDDGLPSLYSTALPILSAHNLKSTDYIISGELGNSDSITASQMLELQTQGHEIGDHTKSHPDLTTLSAAEITDQIAGAKQDLENLGASYITTFAYPYGTWNDLTDSIVKQSGLLGARTALLQDGGANYRDANPFLLRTMSVETDTPLSQVKKWIDDAKKTKTWLILVFHGVDNSGGKYSTSPDELNAICDYVVSSGIKSVTNQQGVYLMTHKN